MPLRAMIKNMITAKKYCLWAGRVRVKPKKSQT
jgi:hypothetical protein